MTHLRLVAGTDVTGVRRRRPRGELASKTRAKPNLTSVRVGAILAAQIEAYESAAVRSPRRRDPLKQMKAEARTVLRSLTLPGEKRTLGEMVDAMTQHVRERKLAGRSHWSQAFAKFYEKLDAYGILVTVPGYWRTPNEKLECEVIKDSLLLQHFPECRPYEPVLRFFEF
ncbi:hypothetical protein V4C53_39870 [Paraburkholderia azotifigens]|uniref:hypothetical protein n=1 Tax=Paraburkholderia azotifigens TaxID=2057004 RepID=UPI003182B05D